MFSKQTGMFPDWDKCPPNKGHKLYPNCNHLGYDLCKERAIRDCEEKSCDHFAVAVSEKSQNSYGYYTYGNTDCTETELVANAKWDFYTRMASIVFFTFL